MRRQLRATHLLDDHSINVGRGEAQLRAEDVREAVNQWTTYATRLRNEAGGDAATKSARPGDTPREDL